jgi:hypothetical protein
MNALILQRALLDGLLYSLILSIIVLASLYWNSRLWIHDIPKELREGVAPLSQQENRHRAIFIAILMTLALGLPLWMVTQWKAQQGGVLSFVEAYLYVLIVLQTFNLVDAVVIDFLIITVLQPRRFIVQGAEGMIHVLHNPAYHAGKFLQGVVFCLVGALIFAVASLLF